MGGDLTSGYTALPGFEHVLVEESWLLYVDADESSARLDLDLVLTPGHPQYFAPRPGEQHCFVGGVLSFSKADAVILELSGYPPATGADGTLDLDNIDEWQIADDHHHLSGSWGVIDVWGGVVRLEVDFPANYRVRFMAGLPGTGRAPLTFAGPDESGIHEGRVVEVQTGRGSSWTGNFQRGWGGGEDFVLRTPHPDRFVLVVGRRAWYVDVMQPERFEILDSWVYGGAPLVRQKLLLVEGEMLSCGIDSTGVRWSTREFGPTFGPVTVIEADEAEATVELLDLHTDQPARVQISLDDGHLIEAGVERP